MTANMEQVRAYYDSVPYVSHSYHQSSPEQLAAVAHLFGLSSPAVETARVLELGGASGGNLVPLAVRHPELRALGLELSGVQVQAGLSYVESLGLQNVSLRQADLAEVDLESLGQFDYIIAHGVYSWVPSAIQDVIMRLCGNNLAPDGIAYLSYNTYPGWKAKEMIRDAMLLHGGTRNTPEEQLSYARGMVSFLQQVGRRNGVLSKALEENLPHLRRKDDDYLAHEYLEPYNLPCYFQNFLERASAEGLVYLAEAEPSMMVPGNYGDDIADPLFRAFGHDQALMEQYLDFAINRAFRQTTLVHAARKTDISHRLDRQRLHGLHFAADLPCNGSDTRFDGSMQTFGAQGQRNISTAANGVKLAICALTRSWPATVPHHQLVAQVLASQHNDLSAVRVVQAVDELLEYLVMRGMARFRIAPVRAGNSVGAMPTIDPAVRRLLSASPVEHRHVANTWHESIDLTASERRLYPEMDGSRDRQALVKLLVEDGHEPSLASTAVEAMWSRLPGTALLQG